MTRNFIPKAPPFLALTTTGLDGTSTSVTYNARGQLQTVTNAKGDVTEVIYNETQGHADFGRRIGTKFKPGTADEMTASIEYDAYGRVWKFTSHEAETTTIEYE